MVTRKIKPIYTLDIETDPFYHGRIPQPFACGLYNGNKYWQWWGSKCIEKMMLHLENMEEAIIYAHNGGRFDFFFIMRWLLEQRMMIIGSRIIMSEMDCVYGKHELRDSYAIMPFALGKFKGKEQKKSIEIWKLEREHRKEYRKEICEYLKQDCVALWSLVSKFVETFGSKTLTIGTASMRELKKLHSFENLEESDDAYLRKLYYYGGRVECFESGILEGQFKVYDVNSMYPYSMMVMRHPIGRSTHESKSIEPSTMLLTVTGHNRGAFPMVVKGKIMFDVPFGTFHVTRHEYDAALDCELFDTVSIERCINFEGRTASFADFVRKFYDLRNQAKADDDEIMGLFYKFILNSAYGKFGQNPDNYQEQKITSSERRLEDEGWSLESLEHGGKYIVWSRPSDNTSRYNVATGSSITGAARSLLLRGIASAKRPVYCDTDSIICEDLPLDNIDDKQLGAWKLETECDVAAIAGRKLYSLWSHGKCVKQANKGVSISADDILKVCQGITIQTQRDSPSFKLDGSINFIKRKVRMTA